MTIEPLPLHHEGVVLRRLVPDDLPAFQAYRNLPSVRLLQRVGMRLLFTQQTVFRGAPCTEAVYVLQR